MPTDRPSLLDESRLAPLELDLRRVFQVMTGLWAVALAVAVVLVATDRVDATVAWVCGTGVLLGFAALGWHRWRFHGTSPG